jgi:hypothetical protein
MRILMPRFAAIAKVEALDMARALPYAVRRGRRAQGRRAR